MLAFKHKNPPRAHQQAALEKLWDRPNAGLFMDVGTGKSWTAIALMQMRFVAGQIDRVLLIAKNGVHRQWLEEQFPEHMSVPYRAAIHGSTKAAEKARLDLDAASGLRVFIINTEALSTTRGQQVCAAFLNGGDPARNMIILDESQDIKTPGAKRTKAITKLASLSGYRLILTGTPISKNVFDTFSQFRFLDPAILGCKYIYEFKNLFCVVAVTPFGEQIVGQKNIDEYNRRVDPHIFRITSKEALDLPPQVFDRVRFELTAEQLQVIRDLKREFVALGDRVTASHAAVALTKIQQVSCGYLQADDGEMIEFDNPRLECLMRVLEQREGKAIIWCRFNRDVENICRALGDEAVHYYGKTDQHDRKLAVDSFRDAESGVKYFVASPDAAGTGLNLQGVCRTNVYYSNSFNSLTRWQSEGRTWRDGTTGSVTYIDLVAGNSPDTYILNNLKSKKNDADLVLDAYRELLRQK